MYPSFKVVEFTLAAAVATSGTFTVGYPTGFTAGDFSRGVAHKMNAMQTDLVMPKDFTLTFGATEATITYLGATTIPAGSKVWFQFDVVGQDDRRAGDLDAMKRMALSPVPMINLGAPKTLDADGIWDGVTATDSVQTYDSTDFKTATFDGTLDVPRNLTATGSAGSDHVCTITGKDEYGQTIVESLTLSGTNVIAGKKAFKEVVSMSVAAGAASDTVDIGWGDVLGLPVYMPHAAHVLMEMKNGAALPRDPGRVYIPFFYAATQINAGTGWFFNSPVAGRIVGLRTAVEIAFTTGGTLTVNVNATPVDGLSVAVGTEAADELDADTATAGHASAVVAVGDLITIVGSAGFDSAGAINGVLEIEVDAADQLDGALVAGLTTASTATSADVRGTYTPATACNGTDAYALLATLPDLNFKGHAQYAG